MDTKDAELRSIDTIRIKSSELHILSTEDS